MARHPDFGAEGLASDAPLDLTLHPNDPTVLRGDFITHIEPRGDTPLDAILSIFVGKEEVYSGTVAALKEIMAGDGGELEIPIPIDNGSEASFKLVPPRDGFSLKFTTKFD